MLAGSRSGKATTEVPRQDNFRTPKPQPLSDNVERLRSPKAKRDDSLVTENDNIDDIPDSKKSQGHRWTILPEHPYEEPDIERPRGNEQDDSEEDASEYAAPDLIARAPTTSVYGARFGLLLDPAHGRLGRQLTWTSRC